MAVTSGFYNSYNHDRLYSADQFGAIFDGLISDGVYNNVGQAFNVTSGQGMHVNVGTGRGWFQHTWIFNDQTLPIEIDAAPTGNLTRIDTIVIGVNKSDAVRSSRIYAVKGTPAASPTKPTLSNGTNGLYEYALAFVTVNSGVTSIPSTKIQYVVGHTDKGGVAHVVCPAASAQSLSSYFAAYETKLEERVSNFIASISQDIGEDGQETLGLIAQHLNTLDGQVNNSGGLSDLINNPTTGINKKITDINTAISGSNGINSKIAAINSLINANSQKITGSLVGDNDDPINIDRPPHGICVITSKSGGTKPTKLGGNGWVVITMNTSTSAKYNTQLAFGFSKTPRIAIRVKNNAQPKSSSTTETKWETWKYSAELKEIK